jgi:hypothetical protein
MVAPVTNSTSGLNSLLRTQQTSTANQATSRASAVSTARSSTDIQQPMKNITLSSSKTPPTNLPRGSIVDKLV